MALVAGNPPGDVAAGWVGINRPLPLLLGLKLLDLGPPYMAMWTSILDGSALYSMIIRKFHVPRFVSGY